MLKNKFLGDKEIVSTEDVGHKTPIGSKVIKVSFLNGEYTFTTEQALELFSSEKRIEPTEFRKVKEKIIGEKLLAILMEYGGVNYGDITSLLQSLSDKMNAAFSRAEHFLWTKNDKTFIPGYNSLDERSLIEADFVLSLIQTQKDVEGKQEN